MKLIIVILLVIMVFSKNVLAQSRILINEFLIDPQPQSVEIFNSGTESADISDWIIDDSGGTTFYIIPKNNIVFPNQCLVFSSDFNLNKTSADTVRLINSSQQLIDSFSYKSSSGSGISYYRFPDNSNYWATGSANLGFYNQTNISCLITPTLTPTLTTIITPIIIPTVRSGNPTPTEIIQTSTTTTPTPQSYDNIYISEAFVNPPTGGKEWVEIYNNNDFPVSLNNWFIDDLENAGSSPKIFSLEINAQDYGVFDLTSSMFNNDGDSVRLLDFNKNLKDDFEYEKTEQEKSLGRTSLESDDFCFQEPSKSSVNNQCISQTSTPITPTSTGEKTLSSTNFDVPARYASRSEAGGSIHRSINYPTGAIVKNFYNSDVLGISSTLTENNNLLINCLTFISFSYSLLVMVSVLIKSKVFKKYALAS